MTSPAASVARLSTLPGSPAAVGIVPAPGLTLTSMTPGGVSPAVDTTPTQSAPRDGAMSASTSYVDSAMDAQANALPPRSCNAKAGCVPNAEPPAMASLGKVITPSLAAGPGAISIFVETAFTDVSVCFWDEAE